MPFVLGFRCFLLACLGMWTSSLFAAKGCSQEEVFPYPLVISPNPKTFGVRVDAFEGWRFFGGTWNRVPLQVDQVNKRGEYVLTGGIPYTAKTDDGLIDANDEIVVSGKNLGNDFTLSSIPASLKRDTQYLWKIQFCEKKNFGSLLIVARPIPRSIEEAYTVRWDPERELIETETYRYQFKKENPVLLGEVWLKTRQDVETALFADSAFQLALMTPWWLPNITLSDENFKSSIESWQVGPVRTIVAVGVKMRKMFSLFDFHMFSELVFYEDSFQIPTIMEFPFDSQKYLKLGSGLAYAIHFSPETKWVVESNVVPLPQSGVDALKSPEKEPKASQFLTKISSPEANIAMKVSLESPADTPLPAPYWVRKDMFADKKMIAQWPWLAGFKGDTGVFVDISRVRKGLYNFSLDLFIETKADEKLHEILTSPVADWVTLSLR